MRSIKKLTPQLIKQIIAEERTKIQNSIENEKRQEKAKLLEALRLLKKIKLKESKTNKKNKALNELKKKLVNKIKKG